MKDIFKAFAKRHLAAITEGRILSANQRQSHVPEENVYSRMHWMVLVTYIVAVGAIALLIKGAS